ncbi:MAG: hypothetical protein IPM34_10620 [Saprospiraceae bacterium]|nr:hypothetical protein [Saprospiraceae bacterium]
MKNYALFVSLFISILLTGSESLAQAPAVRTDFIKCNLIDQNINRNFLNDKLLLNFLQTRFDHLSDYRGGCIVDEPSQRRGISADGEPLASAANDGNVIESTNEFKLWTSAVEHFENYNFKEASKLFYQITELQPENERAKFYHAMSQLYMGQYGPAAHKLSKLNKLVSLKNAASDVEFRDDIKFYFAWSALKVCDEPRMALILFNQLNYEGGKYQYVAKEMINLLRQ